MKIWKGIAVLLFLLLLLQVNPTRSWAQAVSRAATNGDSSFDLPTNGEVEKNIFDKSEQGTQYLIKTLLVVESDKIFSICGSGSPITNKEEILAEPMGDDTFKKLILELADRRGEPVRRAFETVLIEQKLSLEDKALVRGSFQKAWGKDTPFTLLLTDKTQTHRYLLRFDPARRKSVGVKNAGNLLAIASKEYPDLDEWDAAQAIAFINNQPHSYEIYPDQVLKIYKYDLIGNLSVATTKN